MKSKAFHYSSLHSLKIHATLNWIHLIEISNSIMFDICLFWFDLAKPRQSLHYMETVDLLVAFFNKCILMHDNPHCCHLGINLTLKKPIASWYLSLSVLLNSIWCWRYHTTTDSRYIAVLHNTILHIEHQLQQYNFGQSLHSWMTSYNSPSLVNYGVSFPRSSKKYDRDKSGAHCTGDHTKIYKSLILCMHGLILIKHDLDDIFKTLDIHVYICSLS